MGKVKADSPWAKLKAQVFLGGDEFVETMQARAEKYNQQDVQIPKAQRRPPPPSLKAIDKAEMNRNAAIVRAHATGAYSYQQIADHFGVHFTTVGRVVRWGDECHVSRPDPFRCLPAAARMHFHVMKMDKPSLWLRW